MWGARLLNACLMMFALLAAATAARPAQAQANFDRPGSDYQSSRIATGDPADCALICERDRHCRAWSFNYPTDIAGGAICWLKNSVPARIPDNCCVSGVRGARRRLLAQQCNAVVSAKSRETLASDDLGERGSIRRTCLLRQGKAGVR